MDKISIVEMLIAPLQLQLQALSLCPIHQLSFSPRSQATAQMNKSTESLLQPLPSPMPATALGSVSFPTLILAPAQCITTKPYTLKSPNHHFFLNFISFIKEHSSKNSLTAITQALSLTALAHQATRTQRESGS